ncbi:hypothetical protein PQX77_001393 [Marasmius sp. AFHP31]|nr:hypothetical protein PQX77_001393 [Marasmius sp. AFHP31]
MSDPREAGIHSRKDSTIVNTVQGSYNTRHTINRGSYNNTTHNVSNHYHGFPDQETCSAALSSRAAFSALHNSEARFPQPNVLPGTRTKIIQELVDWIEDSSADKSGVHWVYGAAGVGKSAIAQALSEKSIETGRLAAAFFFSRNDASRDKLDPFIPTITHQLVNSPALKPLLMPLVDDALRSTPGIWEINWEDQFKAIIQEPCARVQLSEWETLPRLVIIDGVDECVDVTSQKRLLETIRASAVTLPLDFLIFSRPEPHITRISGHESFIPAPRITSLADFAVRNDIEKYLRQEFERLREEHKGTLPVSWPGDNVIMVLVDRSTGQFIYVTTVIKFLRTGKVPVTPQQRLEVVLRTEPVSHSASPYPDLDQLYSQILHFCQNDGRKLQRVLQLIVSPFNPGILDASQLQGLDSMELTSAVMIEKLLGLGPGEVTALLSGLHSILHIPEDRAERVSVLHASFTDFLLDRNRSGDYHIGEKLGQKAWPEMIVAYRAKWLSRVSAGDRFTPFLGGLYVHDLGSLNLWEYLHIKLCYGDIAITDDIAEALNGFDPHRYLEISLHWKCKISLMLGYQHYEVFPEDRQNPQYRGIFDRIKGVRTQLEDLYDVFHLLKHKHPRKLHKFVKNCKSFFRGFYLAFPHEHRCTKYGYNRVGMADLADRIIPLLQSHSSTTFRILPFGQTKHGIPPTWDIEHISPVRGQLLWKLLTLLVEDFDGRLVMESRITHIVSSDKTEDWPYNFAMLNWGKTWRTYSKYQQPWDKLYDAFRRARGSLHRLHLGKDPRILYQQAISKTQHQLVLQSAGIAPSGAGLAFPHVNSREGMGGDDDDGVENACFDGEVGK